MPERPHKGRVEVREGCVELSWRAAKPDPDHLPAAAWEVLRASAPGPGEEPIYRVVEVATLPSYRDCSLAAGDAAWYVVRAVSADGKRGPATDPVPAANPAPPPAPAGLTAGPGDGFVDLVWRAPAAPPQSVIGYNVYRSPDSNAFPRRPLNSEPLTQPSYTDGPLDNNALFFYQVRAALLPEGAVPAEGPATPAVSAAPRDLAPPAAPQGLTAASGPAGVNLRWLRNQEPDLNGYLVYRRPRGQASFAALTPAPIAETAFVDSSAQLGSEYEYAIRAADAAVPPNLSPFSDVQAVFLPP